MGADAGACRCTFVGRRRTGRGCEHGGCTLQTARRGSMGAKEVPHVKWACSVARDQQSVGGATAFKGWRAMASKAKRWPSAARPAAWPSACLP